MDKKGIENWREKRIRVYLKNGHYYEGKIYGDVYHDSFFMHDIKNNPVQIFISDLSVIKLAEASQ